MITTDNTNDQQYVGIKDKNNSSKKECTSCEQNNVDTITEGIDSVTVLDDTSACANCGKEGNSNDMNICNKCKQVKYCNAACKKKHRSKHKKHCERYVAELYDKKLFKQPPPEEDCPICFLLLPSLLTGRTYMPCCGKVICCGCMHAPVYDSQGNKVEKRKCGFCRTPHPASNEENMERIKKRLDLDDPSAIYNQGCDYRDGSRGFPQDYVKALECWHRAAKFGFMAAYTHIGYTYKNGEGVEIDKKKAVYYYELAALGGNVNARFSLGVNEGRAGNFDRALKHFMIAARGGNTDSLKSIHKLYELKVATKEDYSKALQAYQEYLHEIKSDQRDKAAAANEAYSYY